MAVITKDVFHSSVAQTILKNLNRKMSRFYFFLGNESTDPLSEEKTRHSLLLLKEVRPTDSCAVVRRINWVKGVIYDKYDDTLSDQVIGIDISDGGYGYTVAPLVQITGGSGSGASAVAEIDEFGRVVKVTITSQGSGYAYPPSVSFVNGMISDGGRSAVATSILNTSRLGKTRLSECDFYVMTDSYDVYKCLDNNLNSPSNIRPSLLQEEPFRTSDGYLWKFMYKIPVSLRTKFLSSDYMPVYNFLGDNMLSSGELDNVIIVSGGNGYTYATVSVEGDGYDETNPILIKSLNLKSKGENYFDANLVIDPPYTADVSWGSSKEVGKGQIVSFQDRFYEVMIGGTLGIFAPYHVYNEESNGTAILKYVGKTAKASIKTRNGYIENVDLSCSVYDIDIVSSGSGYIRDPYVYIISDGDSGVGATAIARQINGNISEIRVTSRGENYINPPIVVIGNSWTSSFPVSLGDQYFYGDNLYTVTRSGTTGSSAPVHTFGVASNGSCLLAYAGKKAKVFARLASGYGYKDVPNVTVTSNSGIGGFVDLVYENSSAKLVPIIENGAIVGINSRILGTGYTYADIFVSGDGKGASLKADFSIGDIKDTLQGNVQISSVDGAIYHIDLISKGYNYSLGAPTVTVVGDGTGATAVAEVGGNGRLYKIKITNPGKGYRWADVVISGGSGFGATAKAIISPYRGHAKDPFTELKCSKIMFQALLRTEYINGLTLEHTYTQMGLIRDPRKYSDGTYLYGDNHSACVVVTGNVDASKFDINSYVKIGVAYFTVAAKSNTALMLQNKNNVIPSVGQNVENGKSGNEFYSFKISEVIDPTVDKYSGDILFIETKPDFTPTTSESIVLKMVLSL